MITNTGAGAAPYPAADVAAAVARALAAARDRPNPALDVYCSPQKYAGLGRDFRRSAWRHLEEGDLPQASTRLGGWWRKRSRRSVPTTAALFTPTVPFGW